MDSDGLPLVGPNVDYTKVGPINHKRTLAFLNHFITHSVRFLNRFSCVCEEKLADLSNKIQRIEIMMSILEAKASLPPPTEEPAPEPEKPAMTVSKDPRYAKYFQMIKVGVPLMAIAPKMQAEGLDPSLLENPDAPAPDGGPVPAQEDDSDSEMSSTSSFSDAD